MMIHDYHRPRYHLSSKTWINDPIPFFWNGKYHIFFQYAPDWPEDSIKHWGHAVSRDAVHWEELPIALSPTPHSPDAGGVWTGCVVEHAGTFYTFYTGINESGEQVQCLATSGDLIHWEKSPRNPIITVQPPGFGKCFRDPHVWKENGRWLMLIGSELPEKRGGAGLLYGSDDLRHWEYLHPLATGRTEETQYDWECPDFFLLGGRHVLLSSRTRTFWQSGSYANEKFTAERFGVAESTLLYAAKTLRDGSDRRLLWGWVREARNSELQSAAGWSGVLSLPRVLSLSNDGVFHQKPLPELERLRGRHRHFENIRLGGSHLEAVVLDGIAGAALELSVRFAAPDMSTPAARFTGVKVMCDAGGNGGVECLYDASTHTFGRVLSEWDTDKVPFALRPGEPLTLRLWIDGSVIEAFVNDRAAWTWRYYPGSEQLLHIALIARDGAATAEAVDVWEIEAE
jgi:beta-fructofuranosidase